MNPVDDYVYQPLDWQQRIGYKSDPKACRHDAWDDRLGRVQQCSRKPKHMIGGFGFCAQHAKRVREKIGLEPVGGLSADAQAVYDLMAIKYIEKGYMYSGSVSATPGTLGKLFSGGKMQAIDRMYDAMKELVERGLAQRRDCQAYAIELPAAKRAELIRRHRLAEVWEKEAPHFYPNAEHGEVTQVIEAVKRG
ncbi:MAG: hypothetical protein FOGNACKC_00780 [Anaerolineae bacterium]|nr:hypothetical protein [Anaerolineae bacterium]